MRVITSRVAAFYSRRNHLNSSLRLGRSGVCTLLLAALMSVHPIEAAAGMFDFFKKKYDVHLSPEVRGSVKLDGKPVAGLIVLRELDYIGVYEKTQKTKTDEHGRFSFPEKNVSAVEPGSIFHEPRIWNNIEVLYENKKYQLWFVVSSSIEPAQGISEKLLQLNCDLNDSLEDIGFNNIEDPRWPHGVESICRW